MLCDKNESLETRNFIDLVDFTKNDPCIFVTYPAGAAGDLLISIIDKHYLRTGCEYYGIADNGRIHMYTTDYEVMDQFHSYEFNDQWFYSLAEKLGSRNLNYSLLDQVIFGCHMYDDNQIQYVLDTFPKAKIINIRPIDYYGGQLLRFLALSKLSGRVVDIIEDIKHNYTFETYNHERVYTLPFGALFNEQSYDIYYKQIIDFLGLNGRLISFDYIKYYLTKQHPKIQKLLIDYSKTICSK